jgi:hypothetical protein
MASTSMGRFFEGRVAAFAFALTLTLFIIPSLIDANRHVPYGQRNRMSNTAFALGAVAALATAGAWSAFGKRVIVMAPDLLRVETEFVPFRSAREYRCAVLQVEYFRAYRSSGWRLMVDGLGGRSVLFRGSWLGKGGLESIGRVIETETGWKLRTGSDFDGWL